MGASPPASPLADGKSPPAFLNWAFGDSRAWDCPLDDGSLLLSDSRRTGRRKGEVKRGQRPLSSVCSSHSPQSSPPLPKILQVWEHRRSLQQHIHVFSLLTIRSQNTPSWKRPIRTTESNPQLHTGAPRTQTLHRSASSSCSLNSSSSSVQCPPPSGGAPFRSTQAKISR